MGALHDGHLSLLRAARERCDVVVMSLFVNPAQFGPARTSTPTRATRRATLALAERSRRRPRLRARRSRRSTRTGFATTVEVGGGLTEVLDGDPERRGPEHFRGVTTVVAKLFNAVAPDVAFFGQKDAQQAVVIRRMARDLDFPVEIVVVPTVREADGLAMSSRNAYLERRGPRARRRAQPRAAGGRGAVAPASDTLGRGARGGPRRARARPGSSPSTSRRATPRTSSRCRASTGGRCWSPSPRGSAGPG